MPKLLELIIRACWPVINYAKAVQEILIKGRSFTTVIPNILHMGLYIMVWLPIGIIFYKKAFNKNNEKKQLATNV